MLARLVFGVFLLGVSSVAGAQDFGYRFEGLALSTYNDNSPYLYDHGGWLDASIGRGADDQFTAGFRLDTVGAFPTPWSDSLVASANLALYTDTQYYALAYTGAVVHPPWRMDAGSVQFLLTKTWGPWTLDYGGGVVVRGNLGGGFLQNTFHGQIKDVEYNLPYKGDFLAGPFVTTTASYQVLNLPWLGWHWIATGSGRAVWDVVGVLNDEADVLAQLTAQSGVVQFELALGQRLSAPGNQAYLSQMYSTGFFFDDSIELSFGDFRVQFGYALNPYGAAGISTYPGFNDQNQEFHWTVIWGQDIPVPWALRFFP